MVLPDCLRSRSPSRPIVGISVPDPGCLIIDDVAPSIGRMSEFGRATVDESVNGICEAVKNYAARRGWTIVRYEQYRRWAHETIARHESLWLSLDPLFWPPPDGPVVLSVRLRRGVAPGRFDVAEGWDVLPSFSGRGGGGLLDDALASGATLTTAARYASRAGIEIASVVVCAATRVGTDYVKSMLPRLRWNIFLPGDWRIMHLRDGCPHLPHTGRRALSSPAWSPDECPVELRLAPTNMAGSLWEVLYLDRGIRQAIDRARTDTVQRLRLAIGRSPTIRDLALLGDSCRLSAPRFAAPRPTHCSTICSNQHAEIRGFDRGSPLNRCHQHARACASHRCRCAASRRHSWRSVSARRGPRACARHEPLKFLLLVVHEPYAASRNSVRSCTFPASTSGVIAARRSATEAPRGGSAGAETRRGARYARTLIPHPRLEVEGFP
jgi:hypothetical protein